jgi:hypothetical protein
VTTGAQTFAGGKTFSSTITGSISGNAGTATVLQTARTINGTSFNGSTNITTANWGTARTLWGQSVNGSTNITAPLLPAAGSVGAPAFSTAADTNTGMYFPTADTIGFVEGGVEVIRINSSGDVGIGTISPTEKLTVAGNVGMSGGSFVMRGQSTADQAIFVGSGRTGNGNSYIDFIGDTTYGSFGLRVIRLNGGANTSSSINHRGTGQLNITAVDAGTIGFNTGNTLRARIDANGSFFLSKATSSPIGNGVELRSDFINIFTNRAGVPGQFRRVAATASLQPLIQLFGGANADTAVGVINVSDSATQYATSSDYRLKEDVTPMVGASDRLKALKPVNFAWKINGTRVDGFLAHEAQEVVPEAVSGEKDAVDAEGNPVYQGIDQSKLVPLLTAALQEALQKIETLEARVAALEV